MLSAKFNAELQGIVRNLMENEGITNYKWEIEGQAAAGDNYIGEIIFFKILTENGEKIHDLVMKTVKRSEELRNAVPVEHQFNRELHIYSKVFPEFRRFLVDVNANFELDFVPKLHWSTSERYRETLVFSNLKGDDYKVRDRKIPWNLQHSLFAMEHYAKFHAISLAFNDQKPELFAELTKDMVDIYKETSKLVEASQIYTKPFAKIMKLLSEIGREDLIIKYDGFMEAATEIINGKIDNVDKIVMTHGDCWNNNFMFKYKDENEEAPWKMCFLDFQLASFGTPIIDLSFNIFTSCDKSCLQHIDEILETYYNTLSKTVKSLGSNPDVLFSRENFKNHWMKYSKFGVLLSSVMMKILLIPSEDAPDLAKRAEQGITKDDLFDFSLKDEDEYDRRVLDVFTFYGDKFL